MKINIYLSTIGLEAIARGEPPYHWCLSLVPCDQEQPKDGFCVVESFELSFPDRTSAALMAAKLLQAEAAISALHYEQRIQKLLAIEAS